MKSIIITPSWIINKKKDFIDGVRNLEKIGFKFVNKKFIKKIPSIHQKVKQLHRAFLNKDIKLIIAQRGGYGSMKLLQYLKFDTIKSNPKIFAGFSDISALLNVFYERTGLRTLHSPMLINFSKPSKFTTGSFLNAVKNFSDKNLFDNISIKVFKHGIKKGILKGGNLITLTALIGTEWEIDTGGCILFFEDVDEKLHGIDRCFTQWILKGKFKKINGLILGDFKGNNIKDIFKILSEQIKINFPVVYSGYIGHVKNKITLPVGAKVELNTFKKTLILV